MTSIEVIHFFFAYSKNVVGSPHFSDYLRAFRWRIVPMLNPDGYEYTWTNDRLWYRNRRNASDCTGVNLNRNFPAFWNYSECQHKNHSGPYPLSEPEVHGLVNYVNDDLVGETILALSLHCFGQAFFIPFAGTPEVDPTNLRKMESIVDKALHYILPHYYRSISYQRYHFIKS